MKDLFESSLKVGVVSKLLPMETKDSFQVPERKTRAGNVAPGYRKPKLASFYSMCLGSSSMLLAMFVRGLLIHGWTYSLP